MEEKKLQFLKDHEIARSEGTINDFFDKYATSYDEIMSTTGYDQILNHAASLLKKFLNNTDSHILDVGCGTGYSGLHLHKAGFERVDGTDPSLCSLREADKKGVYSNIFKGKITEDEKLSCDENTYDGVFCIGTITKGHLELKPALGEFLRVTRPGGYMVFTVRNDKLDQVKMMEDMGRMMDGRKLELISIEKKPYFEDLFCLCCVFQVF